MKPKFVVVLVVLLLVAMIPALVMAAGQAKPQSTGRITIDIRQPIGPQIDAQRGPTSRGPRAVGGPLQAAPRVTNLGIQPNAVYALLNTSFEAPNWPSTSGNADGFQFAEFGLSPVGWDATDYLAKRGQQSLYSAGWLNDPYVNPFYDNDMYSWAVYPMDLQGARRAHLRFQFLSDTEFGFDAFYWCASADQFVYTCEWHTGSTNDKWRLVQLDSRTSPLLASMLDEPFAAVGFLFESDFIIVDRGTFVDPLRVRVWGPSPIN